MSGKNYGSAQELAQMLKALPEQLKPGQTDPGQLRKMDDTINSIYGDLQSKLGITEREVIGNYQPLKGTGAAWQQVSQQTTDRAARIVAIAAQPDKFVASSKQDHAGRVFDQAYEALRGLFSQLGISAPASTAGARTSSSSGTNR